MRKKFRASYQYLKELIQEIEKKARKNHSKENLEILRKQAEDKLGMPFDFDEVLY